MHGNRNADEVRANDFLGIEIFDGDVHRIRFESRPPEEASRQGDAERLMAQLVAGNEQYRTWGP
jgi:hypothetical protein